MNFVKVTLISVSPFVFALFNAAAAAGESSREERSLDERIRNL